MCAQATTTAPSPTDESHFRKAAKRAQSDFEAFRQTHLPRYESGSTRDACDERIGRFCYWHREGDSIVEEPKRITVERERLIDKFDQLAGAAPRDDWIAAQRVRYLIEAGYDSSALLAAYECQGTAAWCYILRGMALHTMQRYDEAEYEFDSALAALPRNERCQWNDISLLLSDNERAAYLRIPCGSRDSFEAKFWELSDPSYVVVGNDRKSEHFFRVGITRILADSRNAYGMSWGPDMREIVIRYGMPISYTTAWPSHFMQSLPITGHEREPCFHFIAHNVGSDSVRWDMRRERARERYSPPYADSVTEIPAQFAMFKRGDSAIVVIAYTLSDLTGTVFGGGGTEIQSDTQPNTEPNTQLKTHTNASAELQVDERISAMRAASDHRIKYARASWKGIAVGIEQFTPGARRIARHRAWLSPPKRTSGAPELSTLLLFKAASDADSISPQSLDVVLQQALTSTDLRGIKKLGVYWEMYHSPDDSTATSLPVSISVTRTDGGFGRWLAQKLRIQRPDQPIEFGWHDAPGTTGTSYRSIILDLSQLPNGTYQIEVSVGTDDSPRTTTSREIRLR